MSDRGSWLPTAEAGSPPPRGMSKRPIRSMTVEVGFFLGMFVRL
jgi:hypothetical protein